MVRTADDHALPLPDKDAERLSAAPVQSLDVLLAASSLDRRLLQGVQDCTLEIAYDPRPEREKTATILAIGSLVLLGLVVAIPMLCPFLMADSSRISAVQQAAGQLYPGLTALVGTAVGYYFARYRSRS